MHDGWTYVLAAYAATAAILVIWFWMIVVKLRKHTPGRRSQNGDVRG